MERLNKIIPYDFVYFSDCERKPEYRTVTMKPQDKDSIIKQKTAEVEGKKDDEFIKQDLFRGKYIKGPLLSSVWLHSLVGSNDTVAFEKLIKEYYQ